MKLKLGELNHEYKEAIVSLYERTSDYFMLAEGLIPDNCDELLFDTPPTVSLDQKQVLGAFLDHELVGLVDCVYGFPNMETSMIGLLLVDSTYRGRKIGTRLFQQVVKLSKEKGMERIRIGVMGSNANALKFWSALGFERIAIKGPVTYGNRTHMIHVMIHDLNSGRV